MAWAEFRIGQHVIVCPMGQGPQLGHISAGQNAQGRWGVHIAGRGDVRVLNGQITLLSEASHSDNAAIRKLAAEVNARKRAARKGA